MQGQREGRCEGNEKDDARAMRGGRKGAERARKEGENKGAERGERGRGQKHAKNAPMERPTKTGRFWNVLEGSARRRG